MYNVTLRHFYATVVAGENHKVLLILSVYFQP